MSVAIRKNDREEVRIERQNFKGHDLVNLRVFYDDGTGEMRPGKQGLALRIELVPELLNAIGKVIREEVGA